MWPGPEICKRKFTSSFFQLDTAKLAPGNGDLVQENIAGQELLFLPSLKRAEEIIASRFRNLVSSPATFSEIDFGKAVVWCQQKTGKELVPRRKASGLTGASD